MSEVRVATVPNQAAIDQGAPVVVLAGQKWPIPMLAVKQNRVIVPIIERMGVAARDAAGVVTATTGEQLADMYFAIWTALTRAHPGLSLAEFDDLAIQTYEMLDALPIVTQQTGMFRPSAQAAPMLGEASNAQS